MDQWKPSPEATHGQMKKWEPTGGAPTPTGAAPKMRKWEPAGGATPPMAKGAEALVAPAAPSVVHVGVRVSSADTKADLRARLKNVIVSAGDALACAAEFIEAFFEAAIQVEDTAAAEPEASPRPWEDAGITVSDVRGVLIVVASKVQAIAKGDVLINLNDWPLASLHDLSVAWGRGAGWGAHALIVQRGGVANRIELPRA